MMNTQQWKDLAAKAKAWTEANFPKTASNRHWPVLGVGEETGELFHSILKGEQLIRGTPEQHRENARDALGDIGIFLMNAANYWGWDIEKMFTWDLYGDDEESPVDFVEEAARLYAAVGSLMGVLAGYRRAQRRNTHFSPSGWTLHAQPIVHCARRTAQANGWDFDDIVKETWDKIISKRDWNKDAQNGGTAPPQR